MGAHTQPGHEYTKSNVKFCISVLQSEAVKKLQAFADKNKETQGKFTIGDEKVTPQSPQRTPIRGCQRQDFMAPYAREGWEKANSIRFFSKLNSNTMSSCAWM